MRTKLKRILSTVLACVMLISLLPATALAAKSNEQFGWRMGVITASKNGYKAANDGTQNSYSGKVTVKINNGNSDNIAYLTGRGSNSTAASSGIVITPADGYYVKAVLVCCNHNGTGYGCLTAQGSDIYASINTDMTTGAYTFTPKFHSGAGYPSWIIIELGVAPSPVYAQYDFNLPGATGLSVDIPTDNRFDATTAKYTYQQGTDAVPTHSVLALKNGTSSVNVNDVVVVGNQAYKFLGWKAQYYLTAAESGNAVTLSDAHGTAQDINVGASVTLNRHVKFTAQWEEVQQYNIYYELSGGTNASSNPSTYTVGVGVPSFAPATRTGYTFEGWYTDHTYTKQVTSIGPTETGNKTLHASWVKDPTATHSVSAQVEYYFGDTLDDAKAKTTPDATDSTVTQTGWIGDATSVTVTPNTTDKFVGYAYDSTEGALTYSVAAGAATDSTTHIVKVYYVKDPTATHSVSAQVEYYFGDTLDDAKAKTIPDATDSTVTQTGWIGDATSVTVTPNTTDKFVGYAYDSTEGTLTYSVAAGAATDSTTHIVKVYYVKNTFGYTVEYYYDGVLDERNTEALSAQYQEVISTYPDKSGDNYVFEKAVPASLTISNVEADNVIKVYYVTKDTSVDVTKVVTSVANPAGEPYDTKDTAKVGDTITWTITVINNGNVSQTLTLADTLSNNQPVTVTDDKTGNEVTGNITIAAKTTSTYTATYTVQIGDSGDTLVNTAILKDGDTPKDGDTAPGVKIDPAVTVDKTVDKTTASVGDKLTYTITVTSNASVELKNVVVTDELLGMTGDKAITIESLAAGGTWTETYTYTVKSSDAGKKLVNTAIASTEDGKELDRDFTEETTIRVPSKPTKPSQPALNTEDHVAYIIGYDDGTVKPTNNITRAEVATIFFRLLTDDSRAEFWSQTNSYSDVSSNNWFNNAVSTLSNAGIISGYPDGTFKPNAPITRAEFAAIATRFSDASYTGRCTFTDVPADHWAANAIALAQDLGWINGYSDGTFKPNQPITRAEAMTLINRVLERAVDRDHMLADMVTWTDNRPGSWYYEAVQEATNSHEYTRTGVYVPSQSFCYENWVKILEAPDWAALENAWSTANSQ